MPLELFRIFSVRNRARLKKGRGASICLCVNLPRLFAIFLALSLLFGPLAMDRAMAAAPASSHAKTMAYGHCDPDEGAADKAIADPCCAATAAVAPEAAAAEIPSTRLVASPATSSFHRGVLSEISTPPPRLS
jgi:hypothetical protein